MGGSHLLKEIIKCTEGSKAIMERVKMKMKAREELQAKRNYDKDNDSKE